MDPDLQLELGQFRHDKTKYKIMSQSHVLDNNKMKFNNPLDNIQGNMKKKDVLF